MLAKGCECVDQVRCWFRVIKSRGVILFAQFLALIVENNRNVQPFRRVSTQGLKDLLLLGGHVQQIRAPDNVADALVNVVYGHRELVSVKTFFSLQYRVVQFGSNGLALRSQQQILPLAIFIGESKTNRMGSVFGDSISRSALAWVAPVMSL